MASVEITIIIPTVNLSHLALLARPLPHHIPEWVTTDVAKVLNVKWPNAVSRATVVAMDKCIL